MAGRRRARRSALTTMLALELSRAVRVLMPVEDPDCWEAAVEVLKASS